MPSLISHAAVAVAAGAAFAPKLIDRPFDHRPIGKERFDKSLDLTGQMKKGLPKPTEFLSVCSLLYAHKLITYSF